MTPLFETEFNFTISRAVKLAGRQIRKNPAAEMLFRPSGG
jgi:hypothetical protein